MVLSLSALRAAVLYSPEISSAVSGTHYSHVLSKSQRSIRPEAIHQMKEHQ
jgi:hypothetical protein